MRRDVRRNSAPAGTGHRPQCWAKCEASSAPATVGRPARYARDGRWAVFGTLPVRIASANWGPDVVRVPGQGDAYVMGRDGALLSRAAAGRADAEVGRRPVKEG